MALDDDKRSLSQVSQKEPAAFGRIKQRALELGMSTEEFILSHDPERTTKQKATESSQSEETTKALINALQVGFQQMGKELTSLRADLRTQPQQANPMEIFKGVIDVMRGIRSYENEVVTNHEASVNAALQRMPVEELLEDEDPFSSILTDIAKKAINGGLAPPQGSPAPPPNPIPMEKPKTIDEAVSKVPANVKELIKNGVVDVATFTHHAKIDFPTATDAEIGEVFNKIKGVQHEK